MKTLTPSLTYPFLSHFVSNVSVDALAQFQESNHFYTATGVIWTSFQTSHLSNDQNLLTCLPPTLLTPEVYLTTAARQILLNLKACYSSIISSHGFLFPSKKNSNFSKCLQGTTACYPNPFWSHSLALFPSWLPPCLHSSLPRHTQSLLRAFAVANLSVWNTLPHWCSWGLLPHLF